MVQRGHSLRDRRRGRFHPDRRSANAADHFRPARRPFRPLHDHRRLHPRYSWTKTTNSTKRTRTAVTFTEEGNEKLEQLLREADLLKGDIPVRRRECQTVVHHVNQALRAHKLFLRDRDYIVKNDEVVIIDEFTGRMMPGRRYSEGQHQALEAKENVTIQPENQTFASVTFQNYFRLYDKLAGMTGTAVTEADEFMDIYGARRVGDPDQYADRPHRRR